jgi:hypothetical protein
MSYTGIVENGAIVLAGDVRLPDGAQVEVVVKDTGAIMPFAAELAKLAKDRDWPADLSTSHDEHLHGAARP